MERSAFFFLFCCFFSVQCNAFHLCRSHSLFHSLAKQCINSTMKKRGTKLLHHIRYKCFNFLCNFFSSISQFIPTTNGDKKNSSPFLCGDLVFFCITCEHLFLCTQSIVNQQRNYDWSHRLLLHYNKKRQQRKK